MTKFAKTSRGLAHSILCAYNNLLVARAKKSIAKHQFCD